MTDVNTQEIKPIPNPNRRNYLKISLPLVGMVALVGGVFFTVNNALQQQQDIRSKAAGSSFTVGTTAIGGTSDTGNNNNIHCNQYTSPSSGTFSSISTYVVNIHPSEKTYAMGIYADSNNNPGSRIATTANGQLVNGWNTLPITGQANAGTKYWLCFDSKGTDNSKNNMRYNSGGSPYVWRYGTFGTWPNPFGSKSGGNNTTASIYATVNQPVATSVPPTATKVPTAVPPTTVPPTAVPPTATKAPTAVPSTVVPPTATNVPTAIPNSPTPTPNAMITFTINKSTYNRGESMTVYWNNIPSATPRDWIGLYTPSLASGSEIGWIYVNCTQTATISIPSGQCTFPIPDTAPAGTLELRLHPDEGNTVLKKSPTFTLIGTTTNSVPTMTTAPQATGVPTYAPVATNTPVPGTTLLGVNLLLHGLGKGGDAVSVGGTGNMSPLHSQRTVTVDVYDAQNQLALSKQGTVTFNATLGNFSGNVDLGTQFSSGSYTVKIKTDQYLRGLVGGIQSITRGQTTTMTDATLVVGDVNNDNAINIVDYNILVGCYSDLLPPVSCNAVNAVRADLNDDGNVNQFDYNLFIRELTNLGGQ